MDQGTANQLPGSRARQSAACCERTAELYPDHDALVFPRLELRWSWRELKRAGQPRRRLASSRSESSRVSMSASGR